MGEKSIYIIDDKIAFRQCDLFDECEHNSHGDCTNFCKKEIKHQIQYFCKQSGVHFHCAKHPDIELEEQNDLGFKLFCPKCNEEKYDGDKNSLTNRCLRIINSRELKNAKLIRVEDWYYPEISEKIDLGKESDYWLKADLKRAKDGQTIVVLYVGVKGSKEKSQFFIKPEKLQLSSDHKDLDPATILAKIEVYLKNRVIIQKYDE